MDAHSHDRTVEIARRRGAQVLERDWRGFIDARLFALGAVRTAWTLMIDADEVLDSTLQDAILKADGAVEAYRVSRTTFFCGRPMRLWSNERIVRVFQTGAAILRSRAVSDDAQVHEVWSVTGRTEDLPGTLLHFSYPSTASYHAKFERYTALESAAVTPSRARAATEDARSLLRFLYLALVRGAVLDGWRGLFVAWWSARYRATVFHKALSRST